MPMPKALWCSYGWGQFLMSEVHMREGILGYAYGIAKGGWLPYWRGTPEKGYLAHHKPRPPKAHHRAIQGYLAHKKTPRPRIISEVLL